jgi:3-deoxy-D-manno-octulosonate 8-phosphate phosphatase (KDO 8-P phosphatase)
MDILNYKQRLLSCDTFIFDVDGVFTDNMVYLMPDGEQTRTANVRDGYAVQLAVKKGLRIVVLSGGRSEAVRKRFEGLGVQEIHLGIPNKLSLFEEWEQNGKINPSTTAYMGDDIPDLLTMQRVHLAACPQDAAAEIKQIAGYISPFSGGKGCVRDLLEQALKVKGLWNDFEGATW